MFVYQTNEARAFEPTQSKVDHYFSCPERWSRHGQSHSIAVVLCSLFLGGAAKVVTLVPMAAFVATMFAMAWVLGDEATAGEPKWVHRISLAATGLLYLGIGYCVGGVVFWAAPAVWWFKNRAKS